MPQFNPKAAVMPTEKRQEPVWKGPEEDGITFSMLSRFLVCRERFRLLVVEGLKPADQFNHRIEYGSMWHTCEEALAKGPDPTNPRRPRWPDALLGYCRALCNTYPTSQEQIDHWYNVCKVQFPVYMDYWRKHPDVTGRTPLLQEQVFDIPYSLPSGRTVRLRGKWDAVDLIGSGKDAGIYLQENKTKADIHEESLKRQLTFDLQTMMYLTVMTQDTGIDCFEEVKMRVGNGIMPSDKSRSSIRGVRYNVVRRPLGGGKGSIVRHKPNKSNPAGESKAEFYERLGGIIREDPGYYFMRWKVEVYPADVERFRRECLDPILEQLCDWWSWVRLSSQGDNAGIPYGPFSPDDGCVNSVDQSVRSSIHFRHPFGVYNPMNEGGGSDLDEYLNSGSEVGLRRVDNLFSELS